MKFFCLQQDILPSIQSVARSVGVHATLPVLGNIMISAKNGKLQLSATNLEIGVIRQVNVEIEEEGEITVPAKTILELLSSVPAVKIIFESMGDILKIKTDKFNASINGISSSEFPAIPVIEGKEVIFTKEDLSLSSQILFASAQDEGRPTLTGILTQVKGVKLEFVATDGFRLAHRQVELKQISKENFSALIPRRTFEEVLRLLSEEEVDGVVVAISPSQNQIVFKFGQTTVSSRLIEGKFPDWEKIIPEKGKARVLMDRDEFLKDIKLAATFAKNEANTISLVVGKDVIKIKSESKELGSQENEIDVSGEGIDLEISFNCRFLQDAVSNVPSKQLMIEFSGELQPALLKPVGVEGLEYIIMPVRQA